MAESNLSIDITNLISIHHWEKSEHSFAWRTKLPYFPEEAKSEEGKANKERKNTYHGPNNNGKRLIHGSVYKCVLGSALNVAREWNPGEHTSKSQKKLSSCHILDLAHNLQESTYDKQEIS